MATTPRWMWQSPNPAVTRCMLVWSITIPLFWTVTLSNAREGVFGSRLQPLGEKLYSWVPAITVAGYLVIAIVAQLRLDLITYLTVG